MTLINLSSMCLMVATYVMAAFKWPPGSHLALELNSVTSIKCHTMSFLAIWLQIWTLSRKKRRKINMPPNNMLASLQVKFETSTLRLSILTWWPLPPLQLSSHFVCSSLQYLGHHYKHGVLKWKLKIICLIIKDKYSGPSVHPYSNHEIWSITSRKSYMGWRAFYICGW